MLLFAVWAFGLVVGFALLRWAARFSTGVPQSGFALEIYRSATTFLTLESGNPRGGWARAVTAIEAAVGFTLLGLVIGYLPVFYQAFSRRELQISLLDAPGGSPPSACGLLRVQVANAQRVGRLLEQSERWAAEILENDSRFR